ncbi:ATP-binding protein, partial [Georgenia sp. 10Sc9-8]|nr:ATP-binding protein [Georgenia halotolerans]
RAAQPEASSAVAGRVRAARDRQARRLADTPWRTNAEVPGRWLRGPDGGVTSTDRRLLDRALDHGALSLRGVDRVLRLAWTLSDLAGADGPTATEIGTALSLRTGGGRHGD